eukprot:scaffold99382_cov19-Tisochrysis_lutea.AAC.1
MAQNNVALPPLTSASTSKEVALACMQFIVCPFTPAAHIVPFQSIKCPFLPAARFMTAAHDSMVI